MAGRPANLRINVTSDSRQATTDLANLERETVRSMGGLARGAGAAAAAAGAAIGVALVAGITTAVEREKVGSQIAAQLGGTTKDAERYGKLAGKLYSEGLVEDMGEAGQAIRKVLQEGIVQQGPGTEKALENISRKVSDLGAAFGEDVGAVTRAVGQLMRTGLARDADHALDLITKGLTGIANRSDDLLDTVNEYATQWRDLGITGEEALGLLSQGLQAGARDSDIVADALKELNIRVKDKSAADALKTLGLDAEALADAFAEGGPRAKEGLDDILDAINAVKDPSDQSAIAVGLLGTQAEDLSEALLGLDVTTAVEQIGEVEGAAKAAGDVMRDNTNTELEVFIRRLKLELAEAVEKYALPAIRSLVAILDEKLNPSLQKLRDWFVDVKEKLAPLKDFFTGDASIPDAFKDLWTEVQNLNRELGWLWAILGPLLLVLGGALLTGLLVVLKVLTFIAQVIGTVAGWIQNIYDWIVKPGWQGWLDRLISIGKVFKEIWDWIKKIKDFDLGSIIGSFNPLNLASSFSVSGGAPGDAPSALMALAGPGAPPPVTLRTQAHVTVLLDGAPIRATVRTQVRSAMQADGARYLAGGWA